MRLSVMFFGADAGTGGHDEGYADILAIARAADRLGFHAVWTPERHFQPVGQLFPSPPVLSAALAVATERIALRGGSVVLPLHHPLRVVEDWSVVDNLSGGRAGFSVATGWHSRDFVLAPEHYADRRARALDGIGTLRSLWAGREGVYPDGTGTPTAVVPNPRPVQSTLPLWLTSSGSPHTWRTAGELRTGVLAATVGRPRAELAERITDYRAAYAASTTDIGDPGDRGTVTLMAHTHVGVDDRSTRALVEAPLRDYLRSYVRQTATDRGGDGRPATLDDRTLDDLTTFAVERYLRWGSLLGSADTCHRMLADLDRLGCDEVACFVDFGLRRADVLAGLHRLAEIGADFG